MPARSRRSDNPSLRTPVRIALPWLPDHGSLQFKKSGERAGGGAQPARREGDATGPPGLVLGLLRFLHCGSGEPRGCAGWFRRDRRVFCLIHLASVGVRASSRRIGLG